MFSILNFVLFGCSSLEVCQPPPGLKPLLLHGKCLPQPSPARLVGVLLLAKPLAFPLPEGRYQLVLA